MFAFFFFKYTKRFVELLRIILKLIIRLRSTFNCGVRGDCVLYVHTRRFIMQKSVTKLFTFTCQSLILIHKLPIAINLYKYFEKVFEVDDFETISHTHTHSGLKINYLPCAFMRRSSHDIKIKKKSAVLCRSSYTKDLPFTDCLIK